MEFENDQCVPSEQSNNSAEEVKQVDVNASKTVEHAQRSVPSTNFFFGHGSPSPNFLYSMASTPINHSNSNPDKSSNFNPMNQASNANSKTADVNQNSHKAFESQLFNNISAVHALPTTEVSLGADVSAATNLKCPKLSLGKSYCSPINDNSVNNETIEKSQFFCYDRSGAILFMDTTSPPLDCINRMLNNFRYDPERSKHTGFTIQPEIKSFPSQERVNKSIAPETDSLRNISVEATVGTDDGHKTEEILPETKEIKLKQFDSVSTDGAYITANSAPHLSEISNGLVDFTTNRAQHFDDAQPEDLATPLSSKVKTQLQTILEDGGSSVSSYRSESLKETNYESFCHTHNSSILEDVPFLFKTLEDFVSANNTSQNTPESKRAKTWLKLDSDGDITRSKDTIVSPSSSLARQRDIDITAPSTSGTTSTQAGGISAVQSVASKIPVGMIKRNPRRSSIHVNSVKVSKANASVLFNVKQGVVGSKQIVHRSVRLSNVKSKESTDKTLTPTGNIIQQCKTSSKTTKPLSGKTTTHPSAIFKLVDAKKTNTDHGLCTGIPQATAAVAVRKTSNKTLQPLIGKATKRPSAMYRSVDAKKTSTNHGLNAGIPQATAAVAVRKTINKTSQPSVGKAIKRLSAVYRSVDVKNTNANHGLSAGIPQATAAVPVRKTINKTSQPSVGKTTKRLSAMYRSVDVKNTNANHGLSTGIPQATAAVAVRKTINKTSQPLVGKAIKRLSTMHRLVDAKKPKTNHGLCLEIPKATAAVDAYSSCFSTMSVPKTRTNARRTIFPSAGVTSTKLNSFSLSNASALQRTNPKSSTSKPSPRLAKFTPKKKATSCKNSL